MAPNDMLHIAGCAPHTLPRTRGPPPQADSPARLGMSQVLWKLGAGGVLKA